MGVGGWGLGVGVEGMGVGGMAELWHTQCSVSWAFPSFSACICWKASSSGSIATVAAGPTSRTATAAAAIPKGILNRADANAFALAIVDNSRPRFDRDLTERDHTSGRAREIKAR